MSIHLMIPARYASTRLPGKVLLPLGNKTMLEHVYDRAVESGVGEISILCDDQRVEEVARSFCEKVYMTRPDCISGTQRIMEIIQKFDFDPLDIIINLQADEPFIEQKKIQLLADLISESTDIPMATLAHVIDNHADLNNPNVVKVVLDKAKNALYFSRSMIPWTDNPKPQDYLRHIGLYAYRVDFLNNLRRLPPSPLQLIENLEQLTVLYNNFRIKVGVCDKPQFTDVNTQDDYNLLSKMT